MITEQQKNNVYKLSYEDASEMLDLLIDKLGIVSQTWFIENSVYKNRKTLNNHFDNSKVKYKLIAGRKCPCVNWK